MGDALFCLEFLGVIQNFIALVLFGFQFTTGKPKILLKTKISAKVTDHRKIAEFS